MDTNLIPLTKGKFAIVDAEDFEWLNQWGWYVVKCDNKFYAARTQWISSLPRNKAAKRIYMHREILQTNKGIEVDHKDGNSLNNQKINLRTSTRSQNAANRGKQANNTSGYKGVFWHNKANKWIASIRLSNKQVHIGIFNKKIEAALAYNQAAKQYHGEFAYFNRIGGGI